MCVRGNEGVCVLEREKKREVRRATAKGKEWENK